MAGTRMSARMIHQGERATIISIINEVTQKECIEVFTPVKVIVAETTRPTIIVHNAALDP